MVKLTDAHAHLLYSVARLSTPEIDKFTYALIQIRAEPQTSLMVSA